MRENVMTLMLRMLCAVVLLGPVPHVYGSDMGEDSGYVENYAENLARGFPVSISISPGIKNKLATLSPDEAGRAKQAMDLGNRFMQQYMDSFACNLGAPDWDTKIAPYVEDLEKIKNLCEISGVRISRPGEPPIMVRLLCPTATLEDIRLEQQGVLLTYQMVEVGKISAERLPVVTDFDTDQSGMTVRTTIAVNANGRVSNFASEGGILEEMYSVKLPNIFPKDKAVDKFDGRIYRKVCAVRAN